MPATKQYQAINLASRLESHTKPWQPQCVAVVDDYSHSFKVAKFHGAFPWHSHTKSDETFLVITGGPIVIQLNTTALTPEEADKNGATDEVELKQGEMFCVPKGMQHRPSAGIEAGVLMVEKVGTVNTGDLEGSEMRVYVDESGK